jgi:hypothetical protein
MSCDLSTSMRTGLTGSGHGGLLSRETLIYEDEHMRYWLDAKGRCMFVVTPRRHVRKMADLTDDELARFWAGGLQVRSQRGGRARGHGRRGDSSTTGRPVLQILLDMGCRVEDLKDMILNEGLDQVRSRAPRRLKAFS